MPALCVASHVGPPHTYYTHLHMIKYDVSIFVSDQLGLRVFWYVLLFVDLIDMMSYVSNNIRYLRVRSCGTIINLR